MLDDFKQLLVIDVGEEFYWVCHPETGNDVDVTGIFLVHKRVKTVHHHIETRPAIPLTLSDTPVKV